MLLKHQDCDIICDRDESESEHGHQYHSNGLFQYRGSALGDQVMAHSVRHHRNVDGIHEKERVQIDERNGLLLK